MSAPLNNGICECGHPLKDHGFVNGFDCGPDVYITTGDGPPVSGGFDVLVCSGGRESASEDPWDHVCGCVLHPDTARNRRLTAEARA